MSKNLKIPAKGLFGLPSSVRQTNNEENLGTQVPENHDTEKPSYIRTEEANDSNTSIPENSETLESTNQDTNTDWKPIPIIAVEGTSASKDPSTTILKELDNASTQTPENPNTKILKNSNIKVSNNLSTQVLENLSTEQLEVQDTPVAEVFSAKEDSKHQDSCKLPKPQKNNRIKNDKKPARKQASVHLTGAALKALHLYAYEEGLEKSEVVEKALRKFIPKRYFQ